MYDVEKINRRASEIYRQHYTSITKEGLSILMIMLNSLNDWEKLYTLVSAELFMCLWCLSFYAVISDSVFTAPVYKRLLPLKKQLKKQIVFAICKVHVIYLKLTIQHLHFQNLSKIFQFQFIESKIRPIIHCIASSDDIINNPLQHKV